MGVNFKNVSQSDISRVNSIRNPPAFDAGDNIASSGSSDSFDDLFADSDFSDLDDIFGGGDEGGFGSSNDPFNSSSGGFGSSNDQFMQNNNSFGNNGFGNNGFNNYNGFNGVNQQQMQRQQAKEDLADKAIDFTTEGVKNIGSIMVELIKSIKNRTADDLGYYGRNLVFCGVIGIGISILLSVIAAATHAGFVGVQGLSGTFLLSFAVTLGIGALLLGSGAFIISFSKEGQIITNVEIPDAGEGRSDDATGDYEDALGDIMDDLFSDDDEFFTLDDDPITGVTDFVPPEENKPVEVPNFTPPKVVDYKEQLNKVKENRLIDRKTLVDTFINFFPMCSPDFASKKKISENSGEFESLQTACFRAAANVLKCQVEEIESYVDSIEETLFSYEIKMKRIQRLAGTKLDEFASELEIWVRESPDDTSVNVTITMSGDYYNIVISKGDYPIITFGDIFKHKNALDYFRDEKHKFPIIAGITALGDVVLEDAKYFDTMVIAGKPRSGKSWYIFGILMSLMLFNSPEDVQFIIIDPKESNLFKTMALMPHVAGLHTGEAVLDVLNDIITVEAPRRKQILADNRVDDIWALREKGVKLPVLYLVMDEYISIKQLLEANKLDKELDSKLQTFISQLPSLGIRLIFVPHRVTGVVNKTNRTMLQFKACVKGDNEEILDTLDIKSWKKPLINPGDTAIKTSSSPEAKYVRGAAVTASDAENTKLLENAAKAFYKMGVDTYDMSAMQYAVNRDENYVRQQLELGSRIQYNAQNIDDDIKVKPNTNAWGGIQLDDDDFSIIDLDD